MHVRLRRPAGAITTGKSIATRVVGATVLAACAVLVLAVAASADPSIKDKRAEAETIIAEIRSIDEQVGAAAERFNGATYELQQLTAELTETRDDLVRARELRTRSQQRIAARLRELYIDGDDGSSIEIVFGARSLDDLLDRIDLVNRVVDQDARIAREATALRARVAQRERQLAAARARQAVVVEQRAAETRAIEGRLAERQRLLASVKDEIARLEEVERRRQAELRRQAQLELARQQRLAAAQRLAQAQASAEAPASPTVSSGDGDGLPGLAPSIDYTPPPADASAGAQVVAIAMQYLGVPYVWGAADPSVGFDCSGLTTYVFAKIGVSLPHHAATQYTLGAPVPKDQLQPGDLVFFRGLGHMGMYIGGGNFIHAPHTGDVVKISPLSDPYYVQNWVGAKRVI